MPCSALPNKLLTQAVKQKVTIISTLDTLSKCSGIQHNTNTLAQLGANLLYGAEIAHPEFHGALMRKNLCICNSGQISQL